MNEYPTPEQILQPMTFKPATLRAVRELRREHPWRARGEERLEMYRRCAAKLSEAYGIEPPRIVAGRVSGYNRESRTIRLESTKLSVLSFLHEFAHCVYGSSELIACRWSVNLFKKVWPRSFERCHFEGHLLVRNVPRQVREAFRVEIELNQRERGPRRRLSYQEMGELLGRAMGVPETIPLPDGTRQHVWPPHPNCRSREVQVSRSGHQLGDTWTNDEGERMTVTEHMGQLFDVTCHADGGHTTHFGGPCGPLYTDRNGDS